MIRLLIGLLIMAWITGMSLMAKTGGSISQESIVAMGYLLIIIALFGLGKVDLE